MALQVFLHHVYEYLKGVRQLILHTTLTEHLCEMEARLRKEEIAYVAYPLGCSRVNLFFGNSLCVEVVRRIGKPNLTEWTAEEDFLLGILLGYDKLQQCRRFLEFRERRRESLAG